jgi:hypothetical protein
MIKNGCKIGHNDYSRFIKGASKQAGIA